MRNLVAKNLVSIIIRTKNEEKWIESCLRSVFNQNYKNFEVILVDNKSADNTVKIAKKYKIKVIEDCAHAIESKYYGKHVGNFGYTGCFSFYVTKNLTTGEGGMLVTNKKEI